MRKAGIKVWMLTGDKLETAENIGYSCSLFHPSTNLFRINDLEEDAIKHKLMTIQSFQKNGY